MPPTHGPDHSDSPLPYSPPPTPEAYLGLLTDPPGRYGRVPYGACIAVTLRGSPAFLRRAENLFSSFGAESFHPTKRGGLRREVREPVFRVGDDPDTEFFCMPEGRIKVALRLYLYGQLYRRKGQIHVVLDADGDYVDLVCANDADLMEEAARLAESFWVYEMTPDYAVMADRSHPESYEAREYRVYEPEVDDEDAVAYHRPTIIPAILTPLDAQP